MNAFPSPERDPNSRGQRMCNCAPTVCAVEQDAYCRRNGAYNPPLGDASNEGDPK